MGETDAAFAWLNRAYEDRSYTLAEYLTTAARLDTLHSHPRFAGMPAFDHVFNASIFEHLSRNPEVAAVFHSAMTSISATEARATSDAYDFKGVETLMDVAGGHGLLLATVLRRHKMMRGVLFDLPHVKVGAAATFAHAGITGRVRIESGDFFKELPSGGDAIIMKHILHDWDDDSATRILQASAVHGYLMYPLGVHENIFRPWSSISCAIVFSSEKTSIDTPHRRPMDANECGEPPL